MPRRRSIRLKHYDYSQAGGYFVTVCTRNRECLFGEVADGTMRLNDCGRVVQHAWDELPARFPSVQTDAFIVMPNHIHGIIVVIVGAQFIAPDQPGVTKPPTPGNVGARFIAPAPALGKIIRTFKAVTTRRLRAAGLAMFAWQRNYYEHIVRNEKDLEKIREYVVNNALRWVEDEYYR